MNIIILVTIVFFSSIIVGTIMKTIFQIKDKTNDIIK